MTQDRRTYTPPSATPIRDALRRDLRTVRMIARQIIAAQPRGGWFLMAAVLAGAVVAGLFS